MVAVALCGFDGLLRVPAFGIRQRDFQIIGGDIALVGRKSKGQNNAVLFLTTHMRESLD